MQRFQALPTVQAGGRQPYTAGTGREPGQALLAMLAGRTLYGQNAADVSRNLQTATAKRRQRRTLLDTLSLE